MYTPERLGQSLRRSPSLSVYLFFSYLFLFSCVSVSSHLFSYVSVSSVSLSLFIMSNHPLSLLVSLSFCLCLWSALTFCSQRR